MEKMWGAAGGWGGWMSNADYKLHLQASPGYPGLQQSRLNLTPVADRDTWMLLNGHKDLSRNFTGSVNLLHKLI